MKIGMIGIGDIAQKAYLPVLAQTKDIALYICTRNSGTLAEVSSTYRLPNTYQTIGDMIEAGIEAAFVHTATEAHEAIIDKLLDNQIHVYVDKPVTYDGASSQRLFEKAQKKGLVLMTGFNRRYAPSYQKLKQISEPNMVLVQKHRAHHAGDIRSFIFDDFIHVIDTMLYLFPYQADHVQIRAQIDGEALQHIVLQLETRQGTAIGIMNRESGMTGEKASVFGPSETLTVDDVSVLRSFKDKAIQTYGGSDWEPTLHKRGFYTIIETFVDRVRHQRIMPSDYQEDLDRHLLAEQIVQHCLNNDKQ